MLPSILLRTAFLLPLASSALAQNTADVFAKAPPEVDDALRARISKFYQALVDGTPRRSEEIVAEDSKDFFYSMNKPRFLSFEVRDITYSENFTKAKALVVVETYLLMPGFGTKPMKVPGATLWKIENGQWCWYIDPEVLKTTPFGKMKSSDDGTHSTGTLPDLKNAPTPETLAGQVKPDKLRVVLKAAAASSDQVTIRNGMPGNVRLEIRHAPAPGLEVKVDRTEIPAGENAVVSFHYAPGKEAPPRAVLVEVTVEPTNTIIPLRVTFK